MNVTNLSNEERERLFQEWLNFRKEIDDSDTDLSWDHPDFWYYTEGNDVYLTKEQIEDPDYILPEWGQSLPDWMREESKFIGKKCRVHYKGEMITVVFEGFLSSYVDYYYRVRLNDGREKLLSCVGGLEFIDD